MEKSTVAFFHAMNGRGTKKSLTFRLRESGFEFRGRQVSGYKE